MVEQVLTNLHSKGRLNETTRFILPHLRNEFDTLTDSDIIIEGFEGAFLGKKSDESYTDNLIISYNPVNTDEYNRVDTLLTTSKNYIDSFDTEDGNINYIFQLEDSLKEDVNKLIEGKYSELDDKLKQNILKFWKLSSGTDPVYAILYKTPAGAELINLFDDSLKQLVVGDECWPKPDLTLEKL